MWSSNNRGEFSNRKFQQIFLEGTAKFHVIIYMAIFSNLILMHTFTLLNNKNRTRLSNLKFDNVKKVWIISAFIPVQVLISSVNRIIIYDRRNIHANLKIMEHKEKIGKLLSSNVTWQYWKPRKVKNKSSF